MTSAVIILVVCIVGSQLSQGYIPHGKDHYLTDAFLREVVDRMSRDLAVAADTYLDADSADRYLNSQAMKALEPEESMYPVDLEGLAPPSLRDQEFLQHSSLWGSQFLPGSGGSDEGAQRLKPETGNAILAAQMKSDPTLPAYCNPPNPCPVGYSAEDGCIEEFENTAAFSRKYQASQDCMCDTEHMFDCPIRGFDDSDLEDSLMEGFTVPEHHKNLVAKKFHSKKSSNPYLQGEKLPIAAKKGFQLHSG